MSAQPKGYFDREAKIKTQAQMMETLKARVAGRSGDKLNWNKPVRNADGSGHQLAAGTDYIIRKAFNDAAQVWIYWAWHAKKLLGYDVDVEIARTHCEKHFLGSGT